MCAALGTQAHLSFRCLSIGYECTYNFGDVNMVHVADGLGLLKRCYQKPSDEPQTHIFRTQRKMLGNTLWSLGSGHVTQ